MIYLSGWFLNTFDTYVSSTIGWSLTSAIVSLVLYSALRKLLKSKFKSVELKWWILASQFPVILLALMILINKTLTPPNHYIDFVLVILLAPVIIFTNTTNSLALLVTTTTTWIALLVTPITIVIYLISKLTKAKSINIQVTQVASLYLPVLISVFTIVSTGLVYLEINADCRGQVFTGFHELNAHLKDVCSENKWQAECPRSQNNLVNYNPRVFEELNACGSWRYYFDEAGRGTLIVKNGSVYSLSDHRFGPERFRHYYSDKIGNDIPLYPPDLPGEW